MGDTRSLMVKLLLAIMCVSAGAAAEKSSVQSAAPRDIELVATTDKKEYRVGEIIRISVSIINRSQRVLYIDNRIVFRAHIKLQVINQDGEKYVGPGWREVVRLAPPQSARDFVRLEPDRLIGDANVSEDRVHIDTAGTYQFRVAYNDAGSSDYAHRFRITSWGGTASARPISVDVK
jgi:hypothetical protein